LLLGQEHGDIAGRAILIKYKKVKKAADFKFLLILINLLAILTSATFFYMIIGCGGSKWCTETNDYSILETCKEHCRKEAGGLAISSELNFQDCMQSLGYYPCDNKLK